VIVAHIAGIPVEEGLPGLVAGGAAAGPVLFILVRARLERLGRRLRRHSG
jgi:hypothetical protein